LFGQSAYAEGTEVRIAIIDTGISVETIEPANLITGANYLDPSAETHDQIGHGTAVAGIIVGVESVHIKGVAPEAKLVPLVITTRTADKERLVGDSEQLAQAIRDAIDLYDCQIINISAGTLSNTESLQRAVEYAEEKGVVLISSVGNDNLYFPENIYYPAAYETVLGVSALKRGGQVARFSQRNDSVSICAPGDRVKIAAMARGKTSFGFGTSYATAYVSGAVALLISKDPDLTPKEVRKIICESADDLDQEGYDTTSGWGALNLNAATSALLDLSTSLFE
jgi:subtilisin family serine protease